MSTITIEIKSPDLLDAINSLKKSNLSAVEAINQLSAKIDSMSYSKPVHSVNPYHSPEKAPSSNTRSASDFVSEHEIPKLYLPDKSPAPTVNPTYNYPITPTAYTNPPYPANTTPSGNVFPHEQKTNFTLDDLARAAASIMGAGKYMLLVDLLGKFGVQALFQLPKEHFMAFATALRQLGAQI